MGEAPVFIGAGSGEFACGCGGSVLIRDYRPENFLSIGIQCFRCGTVRVTPGLADGEVLAGHAVAVARNQVPSLVSARVAHGAVLACAEEVGYRFALTQPRDPPGDPMRIAPNVLDSLGAEYDRLAGGHLEEQFESARRAGSLDASIFPFAWSLLRLRDKAGQPGWSWIYDSDDAMAAMHLAALWHMLACWGSHPLLTRLASRLAEPGEFLPTVCVLGVAQLLFASGNRIGFTLAGHEQVKLHFSTPAGEPMSLGLSHPDKLQWKQRDRWSAQTISSAVTETLASARGQVNRARPGIVVLSASILLPNFDQALVDGMNATLRSVGRKQRGVAAMAAVMPKVLPTRMPDQVGFGYAFYPVRNPHFAGENPVRLGSEQEFAALADGTKAHR